MTHNTWIANQNLSILCLFLAEISMKFHSKDTSLRNMTCNCSIQNHNFHEFLLIVSWNWVWNFIQMIPPWEIWHITLQFQIKISQIPPWEILCNLFYWLKLSMNFHSNDTSLRNMTHNTSIQNQISQFCAYFWLKLVWYFI